MFKSFWINKENKNQILKYKKNDFYENIEIKLRKN